MKLGDCKVGDTVWYQPDYVTASTPHKYLIERIVPGMVEASFSGRVGDNHLFHPSMEVEAGAEEAIQHRSQIGYRHPPAESQKHHYDAWVVAGKHKN